MKTIVFKLKKGHEKTTMNGWNRVEIIPGLSAPMSFGAIGDKQSNVEILQRTFAFFDGELGTLSEDMMDDACEDPEYMGASYVITYEESIWL